MKTTVVLNNVTKTNISITAFFVCVKNKFDTILFVAILTKIQEFKLIIGLYWHGHDSCPR